ncbi:MAG: hypothetical protein ACKOLA_11500 [Spartobacteria bacterium]
MSYQPCEHSRAMITKILRLLALAASRIQTLIRSRSQSRFVNRQAEFRF